MTPPIAIRVENLAKRYVLRHQKRANYRTLREAMTKQVRGLFRRHDATSEREEFYALRDINFELGRGEVLGIIGRNGAGKSTLLKLLSRITEPTEGSISLKGRVSSLLEVGTGFHPELTGRENIYLNGAVLGMSHAEVRRKFDEIVAFAETEKFLDTPVKHYSSGMYMRLAFAVAAHLEPEILIVDEVLAVGDAEFQKKCLGKMHDISHGGRTVLFVSHNIGAISALCTKVMLLEQGRMTGFGPTGQMIEQYSARVASTKWEGDTGNAKVRMKRTWVRSLSPDGIFHTAAEIEVGLELEVIEPVGSLIMGFNLYSEYGQPLAYVLQDDRQSDAPPTYRPGPMHRRFRIPAHSLSQGSYHVEFDVGLHNLERIIERQGALSFSVENREGLGRRFVTPIDRRYVSLFRPDWTADA